MAPKKPNAAKAARPPAKLGEDLWVLGAIGAVVVLAAYRRAAPWLASHEAEVGAGAVAIAVTAGTAAMFVTRTLRRPAHSRTTHRAGPPKTRRLVDSWRRSDRNVPDGWASRHDLGPLLVPSPPGNRIVLGRLGRSLLAAEERQSVLLVGPTQSGKTSGLAIPAILEWAGPVVATSVKADLVTATREARARLGPIDIYDPSGSTGLPAMGWSPLAGSGSWAGAKEMASALCGVARADGGMEDAGFWYASAEKLLAPLLFAAASSGDSMSEVVRWIDTEEMHEPLLALELAGVPDAVRALRTSYGREDRQRGSIFATAETVVAAFSDPTVAASARGPSLQPGALADGTLRTLYCCAPARDQERLRPIFVALLRQIIDSAFDKAMRTPGGLDPPLLIVLDEAANIAPLADLDTVLSTAASHGIQLLTVWQDLSQIEARYQRRWPTIVNNHRAKVVCPGVCDPLTLDHMSAVIGQGETCEVSTTVGYDGHQSRTETAGSKPIAPGSKLRQLPPGEAVVIYGAMPPAKVRLRPYFEEGGCRADPRSKTPVGPN